ncbi:ABC transporter permease [Microbacterium shaanxiense]
MTAVRAVISRNLRLFFRDRMAVFFSLLAAMILFVLYTLFLGQLQASDLQESFPAATPRQIRAFIDSWMFAGVVSMTSITTGLGALGVFVEDAATGRFRDFLVSPIRPGQLVLGYFGAALIIAVTITFTILAVSLAYLALADGILLPVDAVARTAGIIVLTAAAFAAISAFVTSFVASPGAYSALSTIVGTTLGFLTGAYIPVGSFPTAVQAVISGLPFAQASMLMRQEFADGALDALASTDPGSREPLREYFGMEASIGDWAITAPFVSASLVALMVLFAWLGAMRIRPQIAPTRSGRQPRGTEARRRP